jgi:RNA polymerase-interacting CarD/CdnL/TRCF family regulator
MDDVERGEWVAVAECGPLEVLEIDEDGGVVVDDRGEQLVLPADEADRRIRRLVDEQTARRIRDEFAELGDPNDADRPYDRSRAYRASLRDNDLEEMAATLCGIYHHPDLDYPEQQNVDRFEEAVFGEMARVLDARESELMREARSACGQPYPVPDRSAAVADHEPVPELEGYYAVGAFALEDVALAGEAGAGEQLEVDPGVWYAYTYRDEEADAADKLLCVHEAAFEEIAVCGEQLRQRGAFAIEGASAAVVDAKLLDEPAFWSKLAFAETETIAGRGAQVLLEENGDGAIFAAPDDKAYSLIVLNLY